MFPMLVIGQTATENYIWSKTYKTPTTTRIATPTITQAEQSVTYFDGLGRPIQQVAHAQSSSGKDIVTPIAYDAFGRQTKDYLPYVPTTSASLDYKATALTDVGTFYNTGAYESTLNPFSEKLIEASPLNRVLQQAAPGNDWSLANNHTIKLDYQTNATTDAVKLFSVTSTWNATKGLYDIPTSLTASSYVDFQLYKTITKDENWKTVDGKNNTSEEFKDKEGKVVLKRTYNNGTAHDTYYVYDQYGNLTFVLPPLVDTSITITQNILEQLCYQYKYDYRNRLVEKKLPGKTWEFIVYDKLDRVRATGPTYSPFINHTAAQQGWLFTKYDVFNRPVMTGFLLTDVTTTSRKTLQDAFTVATTNFNESKATVNVTFNTVTHRYTNVSWPTLDYHILTVNYYDDYQFPLTSSTLPTIPAQIEGDNTLSGASGNTKTLLTGSFTRVCTTSENIYFNGQSFQTAGAGETTYTVYDRKARPVRVHKRNHLGGYTETDSKLNFAGQLQYTIQRQALFYNPPSIIIREDFTYSPQGRLLTHTHQVGDSSIETLAKYEYDELGQLITKKVGGNTTTELQKVDMKYNIRGWLKEINDISALSTDLFAFKINYNDPDANFNGAALYNGNISQTHWKMATDNFNKSYGYSYDNLNRLLHAKYYAANNPAHTNRYNETLQYDKNGNITSLNRVGSYNNYNNIIDDLNYSYDGNQLKTVTELPTGNASVGFIDGNAGTTTNPDYTYDAFGNMIADKNKGITNIRYNHLNLPMYINIKNNNGGNDHEIEYIYNAAGVKVEKYTWDNSVYTANEYIKTYYLSGYQYSKTTTAHYYGVYYGRRTGSSTSTYSPTFANIKFFPHAEGYVNAEFFQYTTSSRRYVYQHKDHLGNIRMSYSDANNDKLITSNEIVEENNYYPFGLNHNLTMPISNYKYKYNGKEYQDELGLNMYDYGARNYDPALGRWMNIDPKAENSRRWTPYNYAYNNPMYFVDPDGMQSDDWKRDINGNMVYDKNLNQFNQSYALGFGEQYVGSSHYEPTGTNTGFSNTGLSYNEDGTIDYVAILNEVVLSASKPKRSGNFYGIGAGGALGGGISLELGIVEDSKNNYGLYFSFIANVGLGADIGVKMGTATPNGTHSFELNDFGGNSSSYSGSLGPFGVEYGGSDGSTEAKVSIMNPNGFGKNPRGYMFGSGSHTLQAPSISVKPKLSGGIMYSHSRTYVWDF